MHEEVPLLEGRKQVLPERWYHHGGGQQAHSNGGHRWPRGADDARKTRSVAALEHPQQGDSWCLCPLERRIRHSAGVTVNATTIEASTAIP